MEIEAYAIQIQIKTGLRAIVSIARVAGGAAEYLASKMGQGLVVEGGDAVGLQESRESNGEGRGGRLGWRGIGNGGAFARSLKVEMQLDSRSGLVAVSRTI